MHLDQAQQRTSGTPAAPTPVPKHLRIGITLFPDALPLDYIGPLDTWNTLLPHKEHPISIKCVLLAGTLDPVILSGGMQVVPEMTYAQALKEGEEGGEGWDGVLVPGGGGARPWDERNTPTQDFLLKIVPDLRFVFTVCTGSWLLASTGLLRGQKATTNKAAFKSCVEHTKDQGIEWVPKARWVVSNNFWIASGVTAGIDMAAAFLEHFVSQHVEKPEEFAKKLLGVLEISATTADDDPWAEYYGLV